jgi:hypothetical protein
MTSALSGGGRLGATRTTAVGARVTRAGVTVHADKAVSNGTVATKTAIKKRGICNIC